MNNENPQNITNLEQPAPSQPQQGPEPHGARLTMGAAGQIANAYARYQLLSEKLQLKNGQPTCIVTPETNSEVAEHSGLQKFLANSFLRHGAELIGSWHIVKTEYEPALRAVATIFARVGLGPQPETTTAAPAKE